MNKGAIPVWIFVGNEEREPHVQYDEDVLNQNGFAILQSDLAQALREAFEAARAKIYNYDRPVMGNLPYELKDKYQSADDYLASLKLLR